MQNPLCGRKKKYLHLEFSAHEFLHRLYEHPVRQVLAILKFLEHVVAPFKNSSQRGSYQCEGAGVGKSVGIMVGSEVVGVLDGDPLGMTVGADDGFEVVGIFVGATLGEKLGSEIVGAPVGSEKVGKWLGSFVGITIFCTITPLPLIPTVVEQPL